MRLRDALAFLGRRWRRTPSAAPREDSTSRSGSRAATSGGWRQRRQRSAEPGFAGRESAAARDARLAAVRIAEEVREASPRTARSSRSRRRSSRTASRPARASTVGLESERQVRAAGAVPATVGVLDGEIVVGLTEDELARFDADARKVGPRDLAAASSQRAVGATTVGGTLAVARAAGIRSMATGGLGGVHRGFPDPPDVSADLGQLAPHAALVVSAGVKSLLDVPATAGAARVARRAGARLPHGHAAALLRRRRRAAGVGARRVGGRGGADRPRALGARRRRPAARTPAGRAARRRRAADRAGAGAPRTTRASPARR